MSVVFAVIVSVLCWMVPSAYDVLVLSVAWFCAGMTVQEWINTV